MNGIYIHIPFCVRKCAYCDFVSYAGMADIADEYIDALGREMKKTAGAKADTVFIGGGTPSLLSMKQIKRLARLVFDSYDIQKNYEFTIEINPETLTGEKINAMLEGGINRASVGVQSFDDSELRAIGRIHDAKTAYDAVQRLKEYGFNNIGIDLMTALPGQTMQSLKNTLQTAVSLPLTHISAYSLIIEEGTPLEKMYGRGELRLPDEDTDREMYAYVTDFLMKNGFLQYEISNYAKKGFECRHNIKYWTMQPYIGIGAAAHSFDRNTRRANTPDIKRYIRGAENIAETVRLTEKDKISEYIITGLRMTNGISRADFRQKFGADIEELFAEQTEKFIKSGLLENDGERYKLTRRGIDVSNSVLCEFV